jgi:hypothetical protein
MATVQAIPNSRHCLPFEVREIIARATQGTVAKPSQDIVKFLAGSASKFALLALLGYVKTGLFAFLAHSIGDCIHVDHDVAVVPDIQSFTENLTVVTHIA